MNGLIQRLNNVAAAARAEKTKTYAALLRKGDTATAMDVDNLASLASELGFTTQQVAEHSKALGERDRLNGHIGKLEPNRQAQAVAMQAMKAFEAERDRMLAEYAARQEVLDQDLRRAEGDVLASGKAMNSMRDLEQTHWELFGLPDPFPSPRVSA